VKTTESGGVRGYDAGNKDQGRKRHAMGDADGRALKLLAHSAAIQDRDGAGPFYSSVPVIENGEPAMPTAPGWGIDVNEKAVRARPPKA
jgi:L-alanine-DL-glutamate epimerase-like enolase superfamily enzyme